MDGKRIVVAGICCVLALMMGSRLWAGDANKAEKLYQKGVELQQAGKLDQAIERYNDALLEDPNHREAMYALGTVHYERSDYIRAERSFKEVLAYYPDDVRALSLLGRIRLASGAIEDAKKYFLRVRSQYPKDVPTMIGLAQAEQASGNRFASENYLKQALAVDPDNTELQRMVDRARASNREYLAAQEEAKRQRILAAFNDALWQASKLWAQQQPATPTQPVTGSGYTSTRAGVGSPRTTVSIGSGSLIPFPTVGASGTQVQLVPVGTRLTITR